MKTLKFLSIILLAAACSTSKHYYSFSTYKYQSKNFEKELQNLEPLKLDLSVLTASNSEQPIIIPEASHKKNEVATAVVAKLRENSPALDQKFEEMNKKYSDLTLAEELGNRKVEKEIKQDLRELKREVRKEVKTNKEEYKSLLDELDFQATGKSQLAALLLAIFLGGLGIHRFYLGYVWQGVVQLLMLLLGWIPIVGWALLAGLFVWVIIDIIRIATGSLGPKNGDYGSTL